MKDFIGLLLVEARNKWHTKTGLFSVLLLVIILMLMLFAGIDIEKVAAAEWFLILLAVAIVVGMWWGTRLPRVKKGHIGFGIAIAHDDTPDTRKVVEDFRIALEKLLQSRSFVYPFDLVLVPLGAVPATTDARAADQVAHRVGAHFLLFGTLRLRTIEARKTHVLDLQSLVRHRPIPIEASQAFGQDVRLAIPERVMMLDDNSFAACEATAAQIDIAAKYVIGTAAAISGDLRFAEQLLSAAEASLIGQQSVGPSIGPATLLGRIQASLSQTYDLWLQVCADQFIRGGSIESLREAERLIKHVERLQPGRYATKLMGAMCAFVLRRDIPAARRDVDSCSQETHGAWMFSRAFLEAYDGDLDAAYKTYAKAFEAPISLAGTINQCEEFIERILEAEPTKYWLYYPLGFINYRAKGDLDAAENDLSVFVQKADTVRYRRAVNSAQKWLAEIAHKKKLRE